MIQVSNSTAQTLQPGQALVFDNTGSTGNCGVCWNKLSPTVVKLCAKRSYDITFHGNITGTAGDQLTLALALSGNVVPTTGMAAVPAADGNLFNVSAEIPLRNCCGDLDRISVINAGSTPVTVAANSVLIVKGV